MWKQHIAAGVKNVDVLQKHTSYQHIHFTEADNIRMYRLWCGGEATQGWWVHRSSEGCTAYLHCCVLSASLSVIEARGGNCLKWAKISLQWPNLWFPFSSCSSSGLWRLFHMQTPSSPPPHLFIPQPSHPLSTPFAPTIPLSPHRPTLNRLLWNLFKYFDISPPLTSRAEMICDSWRWARSEELPPTPCLRFPSRPSL